MKKGLTTQQVKKQRQTDGYNEIVTVKKISPLALFMKQFQDFIVAVLIVATAIAAFLGEYIDASAIFLIVFMNAFIGYIQERRAEKAVDQLKQLAAPEMDVLRDNRWQEVKANEAVRGDIVKLQAGSRVPADMTLLEATDLHVEEAALTGESEAVHKKVGKVRLDAPIHERTNACFKGTTVVRGSAIGMVTEIGMETELGKIAHLIDQTERKQTPLQKRLDELGKILVLTVLMLVILTVLIGIYNGKPLYDMFLAGISLAVAVIPEGLPAIVTVALSIGVQRMMKQRVIVQKLQAVETLGCATVICTDKTGTITENQMAVTDLWLAGHSYTYQALPEGNQIVDKLLAYGALCNEAKLHVKRGEFIALGNATDRAIKIAAREQGFSYEAEQAYQIIKRSPFDALKKEMRVTVEEDEKIEIVKGAPEQMIQLASVILTDDGLKRLSEKEIMAAVDQLSEKGLRVIGLCYRKRHDYIFLGLFGMHDPPRAGVKESITRMKQAGIATKMITGDYEKTAAAIGRDVGLYEAGDKLLTGEAMGQLSAQQFDQAVNEAAIFARVSPAQKMQIVESLQAAGHIVAMTGDGVNDAPAIKASHIGISMGQTGTDVTKEAAHIVLSDDNYAQIERAVKEGRHIYKNIRKFIRYLLTSNIGEIFVMLFAMIASLPLPLTPVQILWINLVTDGFPAIALGLDKAEEDVMKEKPRHPNESIFARGLGKKIVTRGIAIGLLTLLTFVGTYLLTGEHLMYAQTMAFATLVCMQLVHVYDCRSSKGIFRQNPLTNKWLLLSVILSFLLLLFAIYVTPVQVIFNTMPLSLADWLLIALLSFIPSIIFPIVRE